MLRFRRGNVASQINGMDNEKYFFENRGDAVFLAGMCKQVTSAHKNKRLDQRGDFKPGTVVLCHPNPI